MVWSRRCGCLVRLLLWLGRNRKIRCSLRTSTTSVSATDRSLERDIFRLNMYTTQFRILILTSSWQHCTIRLYQFFLHLPLVKQGFSVIAVQSTQQERVDQVRSHVVVGPNGGAFATSPLKSPHFGYHRLQPKFGRCRQVRGEKDYTEP